MLAVINFFLANKLPKNLTGWVGCLWLIGQKVVTGWYAEPLIGLDLIGLDLIGLDLIGLDLIGLVLIGYQY